MARVFAAYRPRFGAATAFIGPNTRRGPSSTKKSSVRKRSYAHVKCDTDWRLMREHISGGQN